ncbi:MAG: universal stress protein [Candidatus Competibacteraceae bacterium]|jgi:universal stress protein A|nr:universal stress protein [Candidatus Competibacteraceae bacterium]
MSAYQHVLWAADFAPEALAVGVRAKDIAERNGARLSLVHVVEEINISMGYELVPVLPEMPADSILREAQDALALMAAELGIDGGNRWVVSSLSTKAGILETATNHHVDLIVVGSHGRHGLALLLGSTANAVLHGAPCDVLAVRIQP